MPTYIISCFPFFDKPFCGTTFALRGGIRHFLSTEVACIQRRPTTWEGMIIRKEAFATFFRPRRLVYSAVPRAGNAGSHFRPSWRRPILRPTSRQCRQPFSTILACTQRRHTTWRTIITRKGATPHSAWGCLSCRSSGDGDTCAHQSVEKKGATPHSARGCLSCRSSWDGDTCAHQSVEKKGATPLTADG